MNGNQVIRFEGLVPGQDLVDALEQVAKTYRYNPDQSENKTHYSTVEVSGQGEGAVIEIANEGSAFDHGTVVTHGFNQAVTEVASARGLKVEHKHPLGGGGEPRSPGRPLYESVIRPA